MLHRYCSTCRSHLHADDGHSECISCFGKSNAETTLMGTDCSHYENKNLSSLCSQKKESDSAPRALLFSSSREPVRKKQRGRGHQCSEWTPHREASRSSFLNLSSIPLPARATWSRLVGVTTYVITKTPAKAIGRFMVSLVVFEGHLWLTLTEIKDTDKVPFIDTRSTPLASSDLQLRVSWSASRRHRCHSKPRNTSCCYIPTQETTINKGTYSLTVVTSHGKLCSNRSVSQTTEVTIVAECVPCRYSTRTVSW